MDTDRPTQQSDFVQNYQFEEVGKDKNAEKYSQSFEWEEAEAIIQKQYKYEMDWKVFKQTPLTDHEKRGDGF